MLIRSTLLLIGGCLVTSLACASNHPAGLSMQRARGTANVGADTLLGPPDLVTTVPFQLDDSSNMQILLPATMGGRHGIFQLDTGDPVGQLLRQYVKVDDSGNLDTVLAGESLTPKGPDSLRLRITLGTLQVPDVTTEIWQDSGYAQNHRFQTNLGRVGLNALESFETIIDYRSHRLVLIRLDSMGHRLTPVPAYTPATTLPLVHAYTSWSWSLVAHIGDVVDTLVIDTGTPDTVFFSYGAGLKIQSHVVNGHLDHFTVGPRTFDNLTFGKWPEPGPTAIGYVNLPSIVGSPFLSLYGVVGLNQRTKQLILYQ